MSKTTFINESGLYSLILSSKLPKAREFKHWVTSEVLPQIRQTGGYISVKEEDDEKTILAKAVQILQKTVEQKQSIIEMRELEIKSQNRELELRELEIKSQDRELEMQRPMVEFAQCSNTPKTTLNSENPHPLTHIQLGGQAFYDERNFFMFAPDDTQPERVSRFRGRGIAQQMSDGTFDFIPKPKPAPHLRL